MISWVFDVDGVLTDTNTTIDKDFQQWFINWARHRQIYLVTGSQKEKTIYQIGQEIFDLAEISFNCLGNSRWEKGQETRVNQFELTAEELTWFENKIASSPFPIRAGRHIELRPGCVNFSILGRDATPEQRAIYKKYDSTAHERGKLKEEFTQRFPRFEAYIGGDISLDICLLGANKGQCNVLIPGTKYFFGDRCYPGGIDEPFVKNSQGLDRVYQVYGYKDTWKILKDFT
jgi:phosphomannomutase